MLTRGDDYPIHQTAEPIAYSGTDRNFYDRYFFNGYSPDGSVYFAVAFGVYPHLNIADAHFAVVRDGVEHCLHASRVLHSERMDLQVGPIRIEVIEPLQVLACVHVDSRFHDAVLDAGVWGVSILPSAGRGIADWLATRGRPVQGQLDRVPHTRGPVTGVPLLDDALAHLECRTTAVHAAGDHAIIVAEVVGLEAPDEPGAALVFYRGEYRSLE